MRVMIDRAGRGGVLAYVELSQPPPPPARTTGGRAATAAMMRPPPSGDDGADDGRGGRDAGRKHAAARRRRQQQQAGGAWRVRVGFDPPCHTCSTTASQALALLPTETEVSLRVFCDRLVCEAYWQDGRVALTTGGPTDDGWWGGERGAVVGGCEHRIERPAPPQLPAKLAHLTPRFVAYF
eukprot:COSAG01_NODE_925_length_12707_cov_21.250297_2_plen_181_part_00